MNPVPSDSNDTPQTQPSSDPTVRVDPIDPPGTFLMTWQKIIDRRDVAPAFDIIQNGAIARRQPFYVVVDIRSDPQFPLVDTMKHALRIHRLPHLQAWLVVGKSRTAQQIAYFLTQVSGREKILWFETMEEALAHARE